MKAKWFRFQDGLLVNSVFVTFLLTLPTSGLAEEKLSALQTALSSTTISGYGATSAEHWENRATGISRRTGNSAVWTGREMIVWGGGSQSVWLGDGGSYNLQSNTWRVISAGGAPSPRWFHGAVWTGKEMLVWGGRANFYQTDMYNDGARYDPSTDNWRPMSTNGSPSVRSQFPAVWTGKEMLVWGGWALNDSTRGDGGRYDPATDSWAPISGAYAPSPRVEPTAVWTGQEMIIFGGIEATGGGASGWVTLNTGARYNPKTDTWTPLPTEGAPSITAHTAVWTGTDMIVWGGRYLPPNNSLNTGARYNLAENKWYPISVAPLAVRVYHAAVWTGSEMLVWGGILQGPNTMYNDGARYNPASDSWSVMTHENAPQGRHFWRPDLGIWTGEGLLFYGGSYYPQELDSTAYYIPPTVDPAAHIVSQPQDITTIEGHTASFHVGAEGNQPLTYTWSFNGTAISDATNATLQLNHVQLSGQGIYTVTVGNSLNSETSREARLTVIHPLATYDIVADYSTNENPAAVWSYGWKSTLGGAFNLFARHGYDQYPDGAVDDYWLKPVGGPSAVYHNPGTITITNNGGQGNYPPGTVWFGPGYNGAADNFGVIRFTAPLGGDGVYRLDVSIHTSLDGAIAGDSDFHVVRNGAEIFAQQVPPNGGASFSRTVSLYAGDTIDFLSGRGADGQEYGSGFKIQATILLQGSNPPAPPVPAITTFSPASGPTGTVVTITGRNFSAAPEENIVYFGTMRAVVTDASAESITTTVPAGANFAPITVTASGLTAQSAAPFHVTFAGGSLASDSFDAPLSLTPGDGPIATVIADLDGDGKPDLAIANHYSGNVAIYRGLAGAQAGLSAQTFADPVNFPVGPNPWDFVVADLDGDGKLDLIFANIGANTVSVLRNTSTPGHLAFAERIVLPVGASPHQIAVGDLDGDGRPDLITANFVSNDVSVLRNSSETAGAVAFDAAVNVPAGPGPHGVGVADLDGDGKLDVVVAHHGSSPTLVLRNTSRPGQLDASSLTIAAHFSGDGTWVAFADLDGDGKLDLIIPSWYAKNVSVFGNFSTPGDLADSSFGPRIVLSSPGSVKRVAIADLNGDGRLDIAFPTELNSALSFYMNTGGPGELSASWFGPRQDLPAGWNGDGISIGDLDLNGRPELVFCNFYDDTVFIYHSELVQPPAIVTDPVSHSIPLGSNFVLSVEATGNHLQYHWYHNGELMVQSTGAVLSWPNAHAGDNGEYFVIVQNSGGSVTSQVATITLVVERLLMLGSVPDVNEGDLISVPLQLISEGDVGGLDLTIDFNPDALAAPEVQWDSALDGALRESSLPIPNHLHLVIALPATTIPAGTQSLAVVQFRARTVLHDTAAVLGVTFIDISDDAGDPILYGNEATGTPFNILDTGSLAGDNNANHRLDIGDAALLMRLIAQLDTTRYWDIAGNDLNRNQRLDSGDVIKLLRIIAGIDPPPGAAGAMLARARTAPMNLPTANSSEAAVLSPARSQGGAGQLITIQLRLLGIQTPVSGVSFRLNYPVDALRLQSAQSYRLGPSVPGNAVAVWNVAPAQNNFVTQSGQISLALSGPTSWNASEAVLAEFTFEVQPGATGRYQWPLSLTAVELTGNGYNNRTLSSSSSVFIGRNPVAGSLVNLALTPSGVSFISSGDAGADYRIDVSEDLVHWSLLREVLNHPGSMAIEDAAAAGQPHRFYRSVPLR